MTFVQIIEFTTADIDAIKRLDDQWEQATEGKRTARRLIVARNRSRPNHYFTLVFFDSYESAMENSRLPETRAIAEKYAALTDGPPVFHDLDIIADRL
jgi:hypothetical protein